MTWVRTKPMDDRLHEKGRFPFHVCSVVPDIRKLKGVGVHANGALAKLKAKF